MKQNLVGHGNIARVSLVFLFLLLNLKLNLFSEKRPVFGRRTNWYSKTEEIGLQIFQFILSRTENIQFLFIKDCKIFIPMLSPILGRMLFFSSSILKILQVLKSS